MKRGIALITLAAVAAWFGLRVFSSSRPLLVPADFTAGGPDAVEFCDPRNPKFVAVLDRRAAIVLTGTAPDRLHLATAAGKPIGPKDLEMGTLRVFAVDDGVEHFSAGLASPGAADGDWFFPFPGATRLFADFTPQATGQEMYAATAGSIKAGAAVPAVTAPTAQDASIHLRTRPQRLFARQPAELVAEASGPLNSAELAVFDLRSGGPNGFAVRTPERAGGQTLRFLLSFPDAGRYVLWVRIGARLRRFETEVAP